MFGSIRYAVMVGAAAALMGCQAGGTIQPLGSSKEAQAQMAAFAAKAQYPTDSHAADNYRAGALISRDGKEIELENLSDEPWQHIRVWVNHSFVREVDLVAAHSVAKLRTVDFYNRDGMDMLHAAATPQHIEVQDGDHLFTVHRAVAQ